MIKSRPLTENSGGTCDWGHCDAESVAERATGDPCMPWLPVCAQHAGQTHWRGRKTQRGNCSACGKSYALSVVDGLIPRHSTDFARCVGSRRRPAATEVVARELSDERDVMRPVIETVEAWAEVESRARGA